jgi:hypothetical protein
MLYLKNKLDTSLLKYVTPIIPVHVKVVDKTEKNRDTEKTFRLSVDTKDQKSFLPPIRYKNVKDFAPWMQFAQDSAFFIKLGNFEIDKNLFPLDRFDLKVKANNVTLDDDGNLFMSEDPFKSIKINRPLISDMINKLY